MKLFYAKVVDYKVVDKYIAFKLETQDGKFAYLKINKNMDDLFKFINCLSQREVFANQSDEIDIDLVKGQRILVKCEPKPDYYIVREYRYLDLDSWDIFEKSLEEIWGYDPDLDFYKGKNLYEEVRTDDIQNLSLF